LIHLLDLHLENFMNIESLDMTFDTNEVVMVYGDNGSGKSSLISAIALALLNYRKGDSYKDFIRTGHETARVILNTLYRGEPLHFDIIISNDKYSTPLTRKITFRENVYSNSECTAFLAGLDIEYLEHVMFLFQRDNSIVDLKSGERAKLLKKLFHFEFDAQVQDLKARLEAEQQVFSDTSIRLEEASKLDFKEAELLPIRDISGLQAEYEELSSRIALSASFDEASLVILKGRVASVQARIARYEADIDRMKKDTSSKEAALLAFNALPIIEDLVVESPRYASEADEAKSKLREHELEKRLLEKSFKEAEEQLDVMRTGICHVCGGAIEEAKVAALEVKLTEASTMLNALTFETKELQGAVARLIDLHAGARRVEVEHSARTARYKEQQLLLSHHPELIAKGYEYVAGLESELETARSELQILHAEEAKSSQLWEELGKLKEAKARQKELTLLLEEHARIVAINSERTRFNLETTSAATRHEEVKASLASTISKTASSIEVLRRAMGIFETEFPNFIILKTCGRVENYINDFVGRVFPYMKVKLSQNRGGVDFYYTTSENSTEWLSVKMASGAQASILSLAWRVAIAKLYGITTLLLDEVDAAATDENSKVIYEFISTLDEFHQLILISHRKEALRAVASLADNVTSYWVSEGVYTEVTDPESLE